MPSGQAPPELRVFRIRAYADADYQAQDPQWAASIVAQVWRANAILESDFGVRLEVESVRPWHRPDRSGDLADALQELLDVDPAADVDWVVGWVGPMPGESSAREEFGRAPMFGRHFVLRAMESAASRAAVASWNELSTDERAAMARERRLHKEKSTFLHEWGHTLGAVHECPGKWIMSKEYSLLESTFSPESARLVRLGLRRRAARSPEEFRAWAGYYRAEASRMTGSAWECEVMEKGLSDAEKLLTAAAAAPAATAATEASTDTGRYVRRVMRELIANYGAETTDVRHGRDRIVASGVRFILFIEPDGRIARWQLVQRSGDAAFDDALARAFERTRFVPPPPPDLRERFRTEGLRLLMRGEQGAGRCRRIATFT